MIGSFILSVIVVRIVSGSDPIGDSMKCPQCGAEMQVVGSGVGWMGIHVVPQS